MAASQLHWHSPQSTHLQSSISGHWLHTKKLVPLLHTCTYQMFAWNVSPTSTEARVAVIAMHSTESSEYCNLVRLETRRAAPQGFTLVPTTASAVVKQLCRTLTLARGLTLYEIWDKYNQTTTAYLVPSLVAALAHEYRSGVSIERWASMPLRQTNRLKHARTLLLERFPRMPEIAVLRVAERAQREHWNGDKRRLEERVVNHVKHEWTSYEMRLDHFAHFPQYTSDASTSERRRQTSLNRKKDEVLEIVKPRMQEVLTSWLSADVGAEDMARFWQMHQLFQSAHKTEAYTNHTALIRTSCLRYHGGLETPANLLAKTELIM